MNCLYACIFVCMYAIPERKIRSGYVFAGMAPFGRILCVSTEVCIDGIFGTRFMKSIPEKLTTNLASPHNTSSDCKPTVYRAYMLVMYVLYVCACEVLKKSKTATTDLSCTKDGMYVVCMYSICPCIEHGCKYNCATVCMQTNL